MLNVEEMVHTNNFTALLCATQEEKEKSGGNFSLYNQLISYLCFDSIREIAKYSFRDCPEILEDIQNRYNELCMEYQKVGT